MRPLPLQQFSARGQAGSGCVEQDHGRFEARRQEIFEHDAREHADQQAGERPEQCMPGEAD